MSKLWIAWDEFVIEGSLVYFKKETGAPVLVVDCGTERRAKKTAQNLNFILQPIKTTKN